MDIGSKFQCANRIQQTITVAVDSQKMEYVFE
jgi:hypothetical protein